MNLIKVVIVGLVSMFSLGAFADVLLVEDLDSGRVRFPSVLEQVRARLVQGNHDYSYLQGDLKQYKQVNEKMLCVEFSNQRSHEEMKKRIEAGLVSSSDSSYPSAIKVSVLASCP